MAVFYNADHGYWLAVPTIGVNYSEDGLLTPHLLQSMVQPKGHQEVAD